MTLRQKQSLFAKLVALLILNIDTRGYAVTFGEAYRSPEEAARLARIGKGIKNSLHRSRLAIDLNLFINGQFQTKTAAYRPLGEWWESQDSLCRWGGRFKRADGNHFSLAHGGRA